MEERDRVTIFDKIALVISLSVCVFLVISVLTILGIYWCHPNGWKKRRGKP
jgi:hypothetical protein